ncbi:GNAT family N-acetyltransferase [Kitasatospora sp. NPDC051705]|uniref:GNAT family N-acetyltransferase n=1 Tax=Kitasatospora sp. NPDC051705 TaxID=3364057 RepID=UPI0037AD9F02
MELLTAHTSGLGRAALDEARTLLVEVFGVVFEGGLTAEDWEHALGGMHVLLREDGVLVGHAAVVQRRMLHGGRALRAGYVEAVGVRADRRGLGYGAALMDAAERVVRGGYELGVLCAADGAAGFYGGRGWLPWQGPLAALTPTGPVATPEEEGSVFVLPGPVAPDVSGRLTCDWRDGDLW